MPQLGRVAVFREAVTLERLRAIDLERKIALPDSLYVVALADVSDDAARYARTHRIRLYHRTRVPCADKIYALRWKKHRFKYACIGPPSLLSQDPFSPAAYLIAEPCWPPENIGELAARLSRHLGASFEDDHSLRQPLSPHARVVSIAQDRFIGLDEVWLQFVRTGTEIAHCQLPAHLLFRFRLTPLDGRSMPLDVDMADYAERSMNRGARGVACAACWKLVPVNAARHREMTDVLRVAWLHEAAPGRFASDHAVVCPDCAECFDRNDKERLALKRLNAAIAIMNVHDMLDIESATRHLIAIHAGLLGDVNTYDERTLGPWFEEAIRASEGQLLDILQKMPTETAFHAVARAVECSPHEAHSKYGLTSPWGQLECLFELLTLVPGPDEGYAPPEDCTWRLRLLLECLVQAHVAALGFHPYMSELPSERSTTRLLTEVYLEQTVNAPTETVCSSIERLRNLCWERPAEAAAALGGVRPNELFPILLRWLSYAPPSHIPRDAIAALWWAIHHKPSRSGEYQRLLEPNYGFDLQVEEPTEAKAAVLRETLMLRRGSRDAVFGFEEREAIRTHPILEDELGCRYYLPFLLVLASIQRRIEAVCSGGKGYGNWRGRFHEKRVLASFRRLKDFFVEDHVLISRRAGIAEKDIIAIADQFVICVEAKARQPRTIARERADATTRLIGDFRKNVQEGLEQAAEVEVAISSGRAPSSIAERLPSDPCYLRLVVTQADFRSLARNPDAVIKNIPPSSLVLCVGELESIIETVRIYGGTASAVCDLLHWCGNVSLDSPTRQSYDLLHAHVTHGGRVADDALKKFVGTGDRFVRDAYETYFESVPVDVRPA